MGKYPAEDAPSNDLPLMISNGFPRGYVPKPIMPPVTQNDLEGIFLQNTELKENSYKIKFIKKLDLMPISLLKSLIYDDLTPKVLFESMLREFEHLLAMDESHIWAPIRHNTVNRVKSKVEQGLFEQEECYVSPDKNVFTIYLKSNFFDKKDIKTIFDFIGENGYGKKKYTGKGHFVVHGIQEGIELPVCDEPNAYMSLSQFIPDRNDPTEGYYRLIQKYGKTGGSFAKTNPFKRPLLMLSSGSTFWEKLQREK